MSSTINKIIIIVCLVILSAYAGIFFYNKYSADVSISGNSALGSLIDSGADRLKQVADTIAAVLPIADDVQEIKEMAVEVVTPGPLRTNTTREANATLTTAGVIAWTNSQRASNGELSALTSNTQLATAAAVKVQDMFAQQYFEHDSPDGVGAADLATNAGYEYIRVGENLALGNYDDDAALVQAWMDSPGHRANILKPQFTEIGVAVGKGMFEGSMTWLAVQEFGTPLSSCPSPDEKLKYQLQANQEQITLLQRDIDDAKAVLASTNKFNPSYNKKVAKYNSLIEPYNNLVADTKVLADKYNVQVSAFNECVNK